MEAATCFVHFLSVRTTLSPELRNHTIKHWVMVDLEVTWDPKFFPDITFFYIVCITVSLVKSIKLFVFLQRSYIWNVSGHHKFPFFNRFTQTPHSLLPKLSVTKVFCWFFLNTSFPFVIDSLKHPAKCNKSFLLMFPNAVGIC